MHMKTQVENIEKDIHWVVRSAVDMADLTQEAFKIVLETAVITEK